jgi:hypothetical protein
VQLPVSVPAYLRLYVPHPESRLCTDLAPGSAIVGLPLADSTVRIYYEGNTIGASNLRRYRERCVQAAGRMLYEYPRGYPTRARADVEALQVVEIGTIESRSGQVQITANSNDLTWWIDPSDLADLVLRS